MKTPKMFRSLRVYNYRVWFFGALISNTGTWMQGTAMSWVVLTVLTENDATAMGITMALQFGPPLLLVGMTGFVADRFDRRRVLFLTQMLMLILSTVIGTLLLMGVLTLTLMYVFAALLGCVVAFDSPVRQAFISDMVTRENASNAIALNSASFNLARMLGPAVAGVTVVLVGPGWVFFVNTVTFIAMLWALWLIRVEDLIPRRKGSLPGKISDGFRYVRARPDLIVTMTMVFLLGAFGMNFNIFASTMTLEFGYDADGFGLLSSILAIGSFSGALLAARRETARIRVAILGMLGFTVASAVSATMPDFWLYAVCLMFIGFSVVTVLTTANGYIQITTDPIVRGRVLALHMAILMGGTPIGAPIVGWVADTFGAREAILVGSGAVFLGFLVGILWFIRSGRVHRKAGSTFALTLDATTPIQVIPEAFSNEVAQTTPIHLPGDEDETTEEEQK